MRGLYRVTTAIYVVAESGREARYVAAYKASTDAVEWNAEVARHVDADWLSCVPWGDSDERTCAKWLKERERI